MSDENTQPVKKKIKKLTDGEVPKKKKIIREEYRGENEDHLKENLCKQPKVVNAEQILDGKPVNEIIDYLINRVSEERFTNIANKAKASYEQLVANIGEEEAKAAIEAGAVKVTENKLLALKRK